jgi:hypothetical protein
MVTESLAMPISGVKRPVNIAFAVAGFIGDASDLSLSTPCAVFDVKKSGGGK